MNHLAMGQRRVIDAGLTVVVGRRVAGQPDYRYVRDASSGRLLGTIWASESLARMPLDAA